jgi:hypothetical protein
MFNMKTPLRVSSKAKLADALGIARVTVYQYLRLPDSPPVRNGYYYVSEWRKFITKKRDVMEVGEKQQLQLELLRAKLEREQHGLSESRGTVRQEILNDLQAQFETAAQIIRFQLYRMRMELAPAFAGLSAREIYKRWEHREQTLFDDICRELLKRAGVTVTEKSTRPATNVIQLDERKAAAG